APGGGDVEGDLGGVDLEGEVDVVFLEGLEDGAEALAEVGVSGVPIRLRGRGEGVDGVPDGGAGEAVDDGGEFVAGFAAGFDGGEGGRGRGGAGEFAGGAFARALGVAVAPDGGREDGLVAFVDEVAHGLADEVVGAGEAGEAVVLEEL